MNNPFLVAIDSFVLNDITRDYFHNDPIKNKKAEEFINAFYMRGAVPVLTLHHIEEMLAHKNDEVSAKSIAFIRELPLLAVIKSPIPYFIGSIIEIESVEIATILQYESTDLNFIISNTKKKIYSFVSGIDFIDPLIPILGTIRQEVLSKTNKDKIIASISRATALKGHYQYKLSEVKNMKDYSYSEKATKYILNDMKKKLIQELKSNGDKKMVDIEKIADEFISTIKLDKNISKIPMIDMIKENSEATDEEFENIKNWADLECIPIFRDRLRVISTRFPKSEQNRILNLKESNCPTWLLWKELYKIRIKAQRASGSDINDAFLAGLCLYANLTIVDKRTHEYLIQIKRKCNLLKEHIGQVEKLSHYSKLLEYLPKNG